MRLSNADIVFLSIVVIFALITVIAGWAYTRSNVPAAHENMAKAGSHVAGVFVSIVLYYMLFQLAINGVIPKDVLVTLVSIERSKGKRRRVTKNDLLIEAVERFLDGAQLLSWDIHLNGNKGCQFIDNFKGNLHGQTVKELDETELVSTADFILRAPAGIEVFDILVCKAGNLYRPHRIPISSDHDRKTYTDSEYFI